MTGRRRIAAVRDERGSSAIEFALVASAALMFIFGVLDVGYALWIQNALDFSVAAAARCASLNGSACSGQVTTYAANQAGAGLAASFFTYNGTASCGCQVTAAYALSLGIPWTNLTANLSSSACLKPPPTASCAS